MLFRLLRKFKKFLNLFISNLKLHHPIMYSFPSFSAPLHWSTTISKCNFVTHRSAWKNYCSEISSPACQIKEQYIAAETLSTIASRKLLQPSNRLTSISVTMVCSPYNQVSAMASSRINKLD